MRSTPTAPSGDRGGRAYRLRRVVALAATVPVLALPLAACSDDGDDGGKSGGADGGGEEGGQTPPLSAAQLKKALLKTGDVEGYQAQPSKVDILGDEDDGGVRADDSACEPVVDIFDTDTKYERTAYTGGTVMRGDFTAGGSVTQLLLSAHKKGDARKWFGDLKKALNECDALSAPLNQGKEKQEAKIEPDDGVDLGDDAVQFSLAQKKKESSVVTVVRTGDNVASYLAFGLEGTAKPIAKPVAEKQHQKLERAGAN